MTQKNFLFHGLFLLFNVKCLYYSSYSRNKGCNYRCVARSSTHPRRPRGSQSGREKRRDESFQVRAKEPLGTDSHRTISKNSSRCRLLIGHKKCFVLLCQIGEQFLLSSLVRSYATAIVSITACLVHAPAKKCTRSGNFQFDIKSPSDFKILSARTLKTLFQKYKLELRTGIHGLIGHVLRKYQGVFKRYHEDWQPRKRLSQGKVSTHFFSLYRDYGNSFTLSHASEVFWRWISINVPYPSSWREWVLSFTGLFTSFTKREIRHFHAGSRAVDGKEMYKKAWCTCKVVVLPCQTIAYLTFSSPPHLKFPIIHDTFWSVKNRIFSGKIELLLLIGSQTFFRLR